MKWSRFLNGPSTLFFVTAISALASFGSGIWLRNILGPELYGFWLVYSVILTYGYYVNAGVLDSFSRDVPRLIGARQMKRVNRIRNVVFTWLLSTSVLAAAAAALLFFLPLSRFETMISIAAVLLIPLQNMTLFHNQLFLTTQRFGVVAMIQLLIGSVQYILMTVLALKMGIAGLFLGIAAGNGLAIFYARRKLTYRIQIEWNWPLFKNMLSYGIPITLIGILLSALTAVDRLLAFIIFGPVAAGYYGMVFFVYQGVMVLPAVLHQVMYPKVNARYGKKRSKKRLKPFVLNPAIYLAYMSPFVLGPLYLLLPVFTETLLPSYTEGVESARLVLLSLFFVIWAASFAQYLLAVNKQWIYFSILLGAVSLQVALALAFIQAGAQLKGIALGTAVSYTVYPLWMMWVCLKDMGNSTFGFAKEALTVASPFFAMIALVELVTRMGVHTASSVFLYEVGYFLLMLAACKKVLVLEEFRRKVTSFLNP